MMTGRFISYLVTMPLLVLCCFNSCSEAPKGELSQAIGTAELYSFTPDQKYLLSNARPFALPPSTSRAGALDRLSKHLANTYFRKTYNGKETNIHFEVLHVDTIATPSRPLYIATVNMVDPDRHAMAYFFQGSTGARTTFHMLGATFLQPQLDPPLIDGLVILYNGEILPELDHINLAGIVTPRMVFHAAKRAIAGSKR